MALLVDTMPQQITGIRDTSSIALTEASPVEIHPNIMRRLLAILSLAGQYKAEMEELYHRTFHENLTESKSLSTQTLYNNYWQAAANFGTAFAAVAAGALASQGGMDASSAVSIATKMGDSVNSWLRGKEGWLQSSQRIVEHKVTRGGEGSRRVADYMEQLRRIVQEHGKLRADMLSR